MNPYIKLAVIVALLVGGAPFAFASTYYQQLSDSSSFYTFSACDIVGSFTVSSTTHITSGEDTGLMVASVQQQQSPTDKTGIAIYTGIACTGFVAEYRSTELGNASTTPTTDFFLTLTSISTATLNPSTTYYLALVGVGAPLNYKARTNYSEDFMYGYLTAEGTGESLPISPGLPGFTDYGIATSSQAVYCYQNFASSTGFMDSVGLSISQGICNVGVFLFIPSSASIMGWNSNLNSLSSRAPFRWIGQMRTSLEGLTASSTDNYINLTLNFGTTTAILGFTQLTVISSTTLSKYYPDSIRTSTRNLIGIVFILLGVSFIYRDLQRVWHKQV